MSQGTVAGAGTSRVVVTTTGGRGQRQPVQAYYEAHPPPSFTPCPEAYSWPQRRHSRGCRLLRLFRPLPPRLPHVGFFQIALRNL